MNTIVPAANRNVSPNHNQEPELTDAQKQAIAKAQDTLITELSSIVTEEADAIIVRIDKAKKDVQDGPFAILSWLRESVPEETIDRFPRPGSEYGSNPDKYYQPYYRDGKLRFKRTSFYLKFFLEAFPEGKRIAAALAHVQLAGDAKANRAAIPPDIEKLDPIALRALKDDLTAQQNTGVKAFRDAIALQKQFAAVNELKEVEAIPLLDKDGNVRKIAKPIKVWNIEAPEDQWGLYSISGFMQFDAAKAAELGGTYEALRLTAKREQAEDGSNAGQGDKPVIVNTNATLAARINDIAEYISNKLMPAGNRDREAYGLFLKDQVNGPDGGDLIYNLNEIKLFVDGILNLPAVQTKLEKMSQEKDAA